MNRARRANPAAQNNFGNGNQTPLAPRPLKNQTGTPTTTPSKQPLNTPVKSALKPILKKTAAPVEVVPVIEPKEEVVVEVAKPVQQPAQPAIDLVEKIEEDAPEKQSDSEDVSESVEMSEDGRSPRKPLFKKIFGGVRKKPSIRAKERKMRQNRHLRKVILPKNALMALYEVKGVQIGDFIINSNMEGGFTALVTVNGCQYEGTGNSKGNAKTSACEKALRDYIIKKMMQKPRAQSLSEPMDTGESNDATNGDENNALDEADDVPMVNLASYALYKLFTAWENEGYHVPEFHTSAPPQNNSQPIADNISKKPVGRNELPANWEIMHPATLLCIMRPRLTYTDCGNNGDAANPVQTVKVIVDDQEFIGTGRSKKIARKNVAIAVCNSLFGTNFQVDE